LKPLIKAVLSKINGLEMWMLAFPIIRCLVEGHEPNGEKRTLDGRRVEFCTRCGLVFWVKP
jgi:hypothetical protein